MWQVLFVYITLTLLNCRWKVLFWNNCPHFWKTLLSLFHLFTGATPGTICIRGEFLAVRVLRCWGEHWKRQRLFLGGMFIVTHETRNRRWPFFGELPVNGCLHWRFQRLILYKFWINSEFVLLMECRSSSALLERRSFRTGKPAFWLASCMMSYFPSSKLMVSDCHLLYQTMKCPKYLSLQNVWQWVFFVVFIASCQYQWHKRK